MNCRTAELLYFEYSSTISCSLIGQVDVLALGQREHAAGHIFEIRFEPRRHGVLRGVLGALLDDDVLLGVSRMAISSPTFTWNDGNVHLPAVDLHVAVTDHLAGLAARDGEAEPVGNVVEAALQLLDQQFAGDAGGAVGLLVVLAELAFEGEVHALGLLLLVQLQAVAHDLGLAILAVLARGEVALLDGAAIGVHLVPFKKSLVPSRRQRRQTAPV